MELRRKVALVTGASRGIGRTIALALAHEGAALAIAARTTDGSPGNHLGTIDETARAVRALGSQALAIQMDVTKDEQVEAAIRATVQTFGRIDILVNNAGIGFDGTILEVPIHGWDMVMNVNLRGPYLCSRFAVEHMIKQGSGAILNISSIAATRHRPGGLAYGVSKAALDRFTIGLAADLSKHRIPVNSLEIEIGIGPRWESPEVAGEAAVWMLRQDPEFTGRVITISELRQKHGVALPR